ncbi:MULTISPECIES: sn-glycerol-3-phosphate ABC transporter ATP-binding protein UgpC [unclassified Chelatococcus]|uniref:ABC transporter ATP-binding protein n=1 Tax=unclassified Chelatococcus TaxID=2638111 RepID=UPI001BCBDC7F|nr:sn-glycerol-3-phosphate ABC transporter ATP-binding protein UgpC [Chelatococcus sp.]MBS7700697.1 sn-glycerol-3-phosphate ABC transporter ATP-binding protein UgpC [Chelatococcus sp. YT9]MBX3559281.1 sn-glycerol-3-phosphate ABC transporter ATP-binding protein UgpC [Chelatococcus sp.]
MAELTLRTVEKRFGNVQAVKAVDLDVEHGEFIVLVGPSGCGKSTLLRMIAGLEEISSGEILLDGRSLNAVAPRDRDMAMVFQDYALYPHMTVAENLGFALKMRDMAASEIDGKVHEVARMLELDALLDRKPKALSGGQRQRVALGRALIRDPKVFLFDEPLSNLDAKLRVGMRMEIRKLQVALGTTSIYVTHDQIEAMTMADRIVVLKLGEVQQIGTPIEIYQRPVNSFVGTFIGSPPMSLVPARHKVEGGQAILTFGKGHDIRLPAARAEALARANIDRVEVGLRAEHISLVTDDDGNETDFVSDIILVEEHGADSIAVVTLGEREVMARVKPGGAHVGDKARRFRLDVHALHLFHPETGKRLG